jgi:hypothetical protein
MAIVHYRASRERAHARARSLYPSIQAGNIATARPDITRTVAIGAPSRR